MRWLYTCFFYLLLPLILLRLLWRARKAPAYARRWAERFGVFPRPELKREVIWLHSVSVGETIAAAPLVRALMSRYPEASIVVTTTTPTGSEQVRKLFGDSVFHVYAPYDLPGSLARFFRRVNPSCLIIMETELWPNTIAFCNKRGIPTILANGRLSRRSASGYRRVAALMKPAFAGLTAAAIQHRNDARRMEALGLPKARSHVTGNIKFDLSIPEPLRAQAAELRQSLAAAGACPVWIAASTHRGEDEIILRAFHAARQHLPSLFLILVPRHPERFDEVARLCEEQRFTLARRSQNEPVTADTQILLGDTMGELLLLFGAADVAFVGGSLVPVGGHNLMEPAAWALPIITGPHLFNFSEASRLLINVQALQVVEDDEEMAQVIMTWGEDVELCAGKGQRALAVAEANRGALDKLLKVIADYWKSAGDT